MGKLLPVWLYRVQLYVGLMLTVCLHNLSEAGESFQESHIKEIVRIIICLSKLFFISYT